MAKRDEKLIYTDDCYWNSYWKEEKREGVNFYFEDIVDSYIDWNTVHSYMEIGGAPGSIMVYMNQTHGLTVSTVDFTEKRLIEKYLDSYSVSNYKIYQEDFMQFEKKQKYDLVASWGFVEHFSKDKCAEIIRKKISLVADEGYLVVEIPNIRKLFWLAYFIFNRKLLQIHNLEIMNLDFLKNQVLKDDNMEILYAGYHIAMNDENEYFKKHSKIKTLCANFVNRMKKAKLCNGVKCWFYPYIVIIAKKKRSIDLL